MHKKTKSPLDGVVSDYTLRILFIFFTLFTLHSSLLARDALPPLVEKGEVFDPKTYKENFYIDKLSSILSVAISTDGKYIVSGSSDNSVKIWERESGKLLKILKGHTSYVRSVAISKNTKYIVSGSSDNSVKIWERENGKLLKSLKGHKGTVYSVAISQDAKYIVSGSDEKDKSVKIWERESGKLLKTLNGHTNDVNSVVISQDAKYIVSGSSDSSVKIWERESGKLLKTLNGYINDPVLSVAISQDAKYIVSGSDDNSVKIWERESGKLLKILKGHTSFVRSVAISKNAKYIVSGSSDNSVKIWERENGKLLKSLKGHKGTVYSVAISSDSKTIVSGSSDNNIKIWDRASGKLLKSLGRCTSSINSVTISQDAKYIISGSYDGIVKIWKRESGKLFKILEGHAFRVNSVAISQNTKYIVSGSDDKSVKIWDRESGKLLKTLEGNTGNIESVSISKDAKYIVSGSHEGIIKIWERESGKLLKTLEGHADTVRSVTISQDGKYIISGDYNSVKIWDRDSGELLKTLEGHTISVAISQDNKYIVSGSGDFSIKIWERKSGKLLKTLEGHTDPVTSVTISQDAKYIISGSDDGSIKIWERKSGKLLKEFWGATHGCWQSIDFKSSPPIFHRGDDGTFLLKKRELSKGNNTSYALEPAYPSDYNLSKKDNLKIQPLKSKTLLNGTSTDINITLKNQGQTSYFIQAYADSDVFTIEQNILSIIKKGEEKTLNLKVHANLPRENPKPLNQELKLRIVTGNGSEFNTSVPISVRFSSVEVESAKVSEDGETLNIELKNSGNEAIAKADVNLSKPFQADIQSLTNLEANATKTLSFVIGEHNISNDSNLSLEVSIKNQEEILKNSSWTRIAPAYEWHIDDESITLNKLAWYIYALWAVGILIFLGLIWYYKRYKNPLIINLSKKPTQLKEAKEKLEKINRLESTLALADIGKENLNNALTFFKSTNDQKAELFAKQIGVKEVLKEGEYYRLNLGEEFNLNNIKTFLLYISDKSSSQIKKSVIDEDDKVFVVTSEEEQNKMAKLAHDKTDRIVSPTVGELTELMLSDEGEELFIKILSNCLSFKDVSPYQLNGDIKNASNFFGRVEILREIIANHNVNYLLVGARQLGKSSILNALERHYKESKKVNCYSVTLDESGDVLSALREVLNVQKEATLEEIVKAIKEQKRKPIFLIDEADKFVQYEKERGYLITSVFRKLSQEGDAMFVMAGFWTLYEYVTLDYQSPLKNFGKLITLSGLEEEACRELMIKPMQRIGVSYEDESIIEETIKLCGYRANYIATVCDVVLKKLESSVISKREIENALNDTAINNMLVGWGNLSPNQEANRLDRLIVYLTIEKESFRLGDVVEGLKEHGLKIDIAKVNESLERLVLGYVVGKLQGNYVYKIPLLRERLIEDDLEYLIEGEVLVLRG